MASWVPSGESAGWLQLSARVVNGLRVVNDVVTVHFTSIEVLASAHAQVVGVDAPCVADDPWYSPFSGVR